MDNSALYKLTYGVFMLSSRGANGANGCIINTGIQVASSPTRIAISVLNTNLTCDIIKESGKLALSVLDDTCIFETIKHFGMQSGRNTDKFAGADMPLDCNGIPYLQWSTCAVISAEVVESIDLGSHTLFIAEVVDMKTISDNEPLTYADYHSRLKPKTQQPDSGKRIVGWRCRICGYVYEGDKLPEDFLCPLCNHPADDFEPIYE